MFVFFVFFLRRFIFFSFFWADCARDQVIFADDNRAHSYQCDNGGNYEPMQTIGGVAFCVDQDGFIISGYVAIADK